MTALALCKRFASKHWDTLLLILSGGVLLWQATGFFLPVTVDLPPMPARPEPLPAVWVADEASANGFNALPTQTPAAIGEPQDGTKATKRHYPSKKPKPQLKPASIHLNSVTLAQLDLLPGVGPKLAKRIIDYRSQHGPFQSLDDLKNVKGIGDKNFTKMRPYLTL